MPDDLEVLPSGDIFVYNKNRFFGPYMDIVELARVAWCNQTQQSISWDHNVKMGHPEKMDAGLSWGNHYIFTYHPIDYVWKLIGSSDMFLADRIAQYYIRWKIENDAERVDRELGYELDRLNDPWVAEGLMRDAMKRILPSEEVRGWLVG